MKATGILKKYNHLSSQQHKLVCNFLKTNKSLVLINNKIHTQDTRHALSFLESDKLF